MKLDLWIPAGTPQGHRTDLSGAANLHDYPAAGPWPDHLGHGDMLVAGHDVGAALEAVSRLDGLRVVQTLSGIALFGLFGFVLANKIRNS